MNVCLKAKQKFVKCADNDAGNSRREVELGNKVMDWSSNGLLLVRSGV